MMETPEKFVALGIIITFDVSNDMPCIAGHRFFGGLEQPKPNKKQLEALRAESVKFFDRLILEANQ
jgi:hypothetical protein